MDPEGSESAHSAPKFGDSGAGARAPWLVLGGGGLKGMAHIGGLEALEEAGLHPQGIVATSIGSFIAACWAAGMSTAEMRERAIALERRDIVRLNRRVMWINGIKEVSVFRGEALREYYEDALPRGGWADLRVPVLINAVDLGNGSTQWLGPGDRDDVSLLDAVYASSALPVLYPPFELDGRAYVDGGIKATLPLEKAQEEGAERIVAIDAASGETADAGEILDQGMIAIHQRIVSIMAWQRRHERLRRWQGVPLLYVRPELEGYGTFDFEHVPYFLDEGRRAMREALAGA